jgi:uncharacterized protein YndB with AHSA1/START domain
MTIRKSILVERPPEISFRIFCEAIGEWWPKGPSFNGKVLAEMIIEKRVGGRFFERYVDGTEYEIGRITAYEPPTVVGFTWRAPSWHQSTQVEVRFSAEDSGTRVELEHSGWEQAEDIRETQKNYDRGWEFILSQYQSHTDSMQ